MTNNSETHIWYVAYGSNIDDERFARYLNVEKEDPRVSGHDRRWIDLAHELYFAGTSKTWGGPVAFLSLLRDSTVETTGLARLLPPEDLEQIARRENGARIGSRVLPSDLPEIGHWIRLAVPQDDVKGKYNALLRLPDVDDRPAVTLTTLRSLALGAPTDEYRELIARAVGHRIASPPAAAGQPNSRFLPPAVEAELTLVRGGSPGVWMTTLPASLRPDGEVMLIGEATSPARGWESWVRFDEAVGPEEARVHLSFVKALDSKFGERVRVSFDRPLHFKRVSGRAGDIPESDVVYLSARDAARFDGWALLITDHGTGPIRIKARDHVEHGTARVAYALRTIASITKNTDHPAPEYVALQPLTGARRTLLARLLGWVRHTAEWAIGAPPLALRSTEALVGDDGKDVVRVDSTALDFLGCESGDSVIVSWARKSCRARVLLHTDSTRERMRLQLAEKTGTQARQSIGDIDARMGTPEHLQAWLSSSVRHKLNIPDDSIVRMRRSIGRALAKNSALLSLPVAGLVFAALAIPDLSVPAMLAIPPVIVLTLLPIRMPHR